MLPRTAACFLLALAPAVPALAGTVTLTLDPSADGVNRIGYTAGFLVPGFGPTSRTGSTDLSGTIDLDVGFTNGQPTTVEFLDTTDIGFTDFGFGVDAVPVVDLRNARGSITSGVLPVDSNGEVNLAGATLTLDEGSFFFIGDNLQPVDLATSPLSLVFQAGNRVSFTTNDLGNGLTSFVLGGPLYFEDSVGQFPRINLELGGNLMATAVVPEPGAALAGVVMLSLTALRRHRAA